MLEIINHPTTLFALLGVLILLVAFTGMDRKKITTSALLKSAMLIALTIILHMIKIYHFPQGGSVTAGSMVPLLLIAFAYGPRLGVLAGFVFGIINLLQNPYILHPVQVLFDYPLPFMAMGLAGFFPNKLVTGAIVAIGARFICHFISGIVFFASYAPEGMSPYWYSFIVNGSTMLPNLIITIIILMLLPTKRLLGHIKSSNNR